MLPTGLTVSSLLSGAADVVNTFGDVIQFAVILGLGIWAAGWVISLVKAARG